MRGRARYVLVSVAAGALVAVGNSAPGWFAQSESTQTTQASPALEDLAADLDQIVADPRLDGGQASVTVRDAATGETLYEHDAGQRLMPASNEKLLTSAVAMDVLGPDYRFVTTVETAAEQVGRTLRGDVYVRGTGDPTLLAEDYADLASQLAEANIRTITGRIVADDTWFDTQRLGNDWSWDDEPFYYSAQISALTVSPNTDYDAGTVIVDVAPAAVGAQPQITVTPDTGHVSIDNRATTVAGTGDSISIEREHATNRIVVSGSIGTGAATTRDWASVGEPTDYAADVFARALKAQGIRVLGEAPTRGATPANARVLAEHRSMTLTELLIPFMKLSNNGHAEVLVKAMGKERTGTGSWSAGLGVLRAQLSSGYGVNTSTMSNRDGSGLSRRDWLPTGQIATLLDAVQDRPWFDAWYESLPIAGVSDRMVGGTLRSRMAGTPAANNVHAKTGSLTGASALSGYVTDADGRLLIFSVIFNDYLSSKPTELEDRIAVRLAQHSEEAGASTQRRVEIPTVELPDDIECSWNKSC